MPDFNLYNLSKPLDISIPLRANAQNVSAWYVDAPKITPVENGDWVGEVKRGGSVNFRNISFNPHGHGTHTECVGHISEEIYSINQCLKKFFFNALLVSVTPESIGEDLVITKTELVRKCLFTHHRAVVIRTLPNTEDKLSKQYSHTNPPYLDHHAAEWLRENGIKHLLIDLPSVDREVDGGQLLAHKAFWNYPDQPRMDCTITEFIFVPSSIPDGDYLLNLQIAPFENDASPSKPVLYAPK